MRLPAALLRRNCLPTLSEDATGALYVAIGLLQSPLYVHHPSGRLLAELLYLLDGVSQSSYFSLTHRSLQPHHPPLPDWQRAPPTPRRLRPLPIHRVRAPPGWRGPHRTRVHHRPAHPGGSPSGEISPADSTGSARPDVLCSETPPSLAASERSSVAAPWVISASSTAGGTGRSATGPTSSPRPSKIESASRWLMRLIERIASSLPGMT